MTGVEVVEVQATWFAGQVIVQAFTVTVKVQVAVSIAASVAVQVTVVVPTAKVEPDAGRQLTVAPEQLSVGVGGVYVTAVGALPLTEMLAGQVSAGGWLSLTVTVKLQEPVIELVQVTVVVPFW